MKMKFTGVDSPFNEDSKKYNLFGLRSPNFGGGTAGKFRENDQKQEMQIRELSILTGNTGLYSLVFMSLYYFGFLESNNLLKTEEVSFQAKLCPNVGALPP